jgi:hypothetical protein
MGHTEILECTSVVKIFVQLKCAVSLALLVTEESPRMYKEELTLFTTKEFAVWANYYHYLEKQPLEVDTWNRLKWLEYYDNPPVTLESQPCKLMAWKCPNPPCRGVFDDKKNPQKICPYCLEVPPPPTNPTWMYSHVFDVRVSAKKANGIWVKNKTWLCKHQQYYDATYQEKTTTETEYVEHLYHLQQEKRMAEHREKSNNTLRGVVMWTSPYPWPVPKHVKKFAWAQYCPKEKNSTAHDIGLVQLVVGKYKKIELVESTNKNKACLLQMQIEHALLHPHVNGPTRANKTYDPLKPENTLNLWGTFGDRVPFIFGPEQVNTLSKNQYSSRLPGYLSNYLEFTKLERIIPSPTQVFREPMNGENYCIYVAFEGRVRRNEDEHSNYVCPMEQVFHVPTMFVLRSKCSMLRQVLHVNVNIQDICKSACTTTEEWLFDTGATVHVTPFEYFLFNTSICYGEIKVANGRHVSANLVGDLLLKSECGKQSVLYSPLFNKNIISAPQLMRSKDYTIITKDNYVEMQYYGTGLTIEMKPMENLYIFVGW